MYRSWECDKVESYDIFDVGSFSVAYYVYGNVVNKVGPIASRIHSWCSDKVRNFVDGLKLLRFFCVNMVRRYKHRWARKLSHMFVVTWAIAISFFILPKAITDIMSCVLAQKCGRYFLYDPYSCMGELFDICDAFKMFNYCMLPLFNMPMNYIFLMYVGMYKYLISTIYVIAYMYASLVYYNFAYIMLLFEMSLNIKTLYIVGTLHMLPSSSLHVGISFLNILIEVLGIFTNFYINFSFLCIHVVLLEHIGTFYNVWVCKIINYVICSLPVVHIMWLFTRDNGPLYAICSVHSCIAMLQISVSVILRNTANYLESFIYCLFYYDQWYMAQYIVYNFSYLENYTVLPYSCIEVCFASHVSSLLRHYDFIIPVKLFTEGLSAGVNYGGVVFISSVITLQTYVCSVLDYIHLVNATSVDYCSYFFNLVNSRLSIFLSSGIYIYILCTYSTAVNMKGDFIHTLLVFSLVLYYYLCACVVFMFMVIKLLHKYSAVCTAAHSYMLLSYYLDYVTYFLTGSSCSVSIFLRRYGLLYLSENYSFL